MSAINDCHKVHTYTHMVISFIMTEDAVNKSEMPVKDMKYNVYKIK